MTAGQRLPSEPAARPPVAWRHDAPTLQRPIDLNVTDAPVSRAAICLAQTAGLNTAFGDVQTPRRLSLRLHHVPVWQAMDALARACGGVWRRDHDVYTLQLAARPLPVGSVAAVHVAAE